MRLFDILNKLGLAVKTLHDRTKIDYVVEDRILNDNSTTRERYRKWNSGFCEYWFSQEYASVAASGQYLNFYWQTGKIVLPTNLFKVVDCAFTNGKWGTGYSLFSSREYDSKGVTCVMMSNQNGGAAHIRYYVVGKWK